MKYFLTISVLIVLFDIMCCRNLQSCWSVVTVNDKHVQIVRGAQGMLNDAQLSTPDSNGVYSQQMATIYVRGPMVNNDQHEFHFFFESRVICQTQNSL